MALIAASACSGGSSPADEPAATVPARAPIAPNEFALIPCKVMDGEGYPPCHILAAGGKYFMMGAPDGAINNLLASELRILDGVLLFSLLPDQLEGLDSLRNETWKRGRAQPLLVAGPEGTAAFAEGLDAAFEIPDAELFARESPTGGYDASLINPLEVAPNRDAGTLVVDTGDLLVRGFYAPSGDVVYQVEYSGKVVAAGRCGAETDGGFLAELSRGDPLEICNNRGAPIYIIE